ncbi:MAG: bifunctional phosphopantothenoylcysteine decarboxylase/phosphopantothenate--cysteine ligase CoaBC [Dehalogenimonas sp.]|uniref:Coenzyme A biosynthesis bifunctional protein CoaBC n=1 Tax=Candidatus Dehalogenimonas loeffleri TaxID=3127115 RepID=A0ABZ2J9K8_9CHLR|nr:bifunctional phosphopantothenoylcysteine decarboxylase/phosphopantothenate--cysteine ligase CoaBC [Dehalogenimonas sp.]
MLEGKTVVLGVTGSVAAYKAADIASKLTQNGARVEVVMTDSAQRFVTPLTFRAITNRPPVTSMWDMAGEYSIEHVSLAEAADVILIAPATANTIARLAYGFADDMICSTVLATKVPVIIAPAMNCTMYENAATQENIRKLKDRGVIFVEPETGHLACGTEGKGRLAAADVILGVLRHTLAQGGTLAGKTVVVTAGGTREAVDPVRYLGNRSSGKMGYELALAARDQGAAVKLIATTDLPASAGIEVIRVETAAEMLSAVQSAVKGAYALVMAAAVADYRPVAAATDKIKKGSGEFDLKLESTEDILSAVKGDFIRIGFAAETGDLIANAKKKLAAKNLDLIVANNVTVPGAGFGADTNKVTLLFKDGRVEDLPLMSKREVAERVMGEMAPGE